MGNHQGKASGQWIVDSGLLTVASCRLSVDGCQLPVDCSEPGRVMVG